jgi:hypothetical protein
MKMTLSRKFELTGGVATGVLGLVAPFCRHGADTFALFRLWPGLLLEALVLFIVPGLLVAIGSYVHSVGLKTWGFVMLSVCGMFLTVMSLIYFFGGAIFYLFGLSGGVIVLSQSLMAIITVISSLVGRSPPLDS